MKNTLAAILIILISLFLFNCSRKEFTNNNEISAVLQLLSGDNQNGTENQPLENPIVVQLIDTNASPLSNVSVNFQVKWGGGRVEPETVSTNDNGKAETHWTLGSEILQKLRVHITDPNYEVQDIFIRAKTNRWAEIFIVTGNNQAGVQDEPLPESIVVEIRDLEKKPLPNINVGFKVKAGGGEVSQNSVITNSYGLAEISSTLGSGAYQSIRVSITDDYYFAKYACIFSETEYKIESLPGSRWLSDIAFRNQNNEIYPHDNRILESENFLTFSDYNRDDIKNQFAGMAEESFRELKEAFTISGSEQLGIFTAIPESKMTIYCADKQPIVNTSWPYGFAISGITHPAYQRADRLVNGRSAFRNTVKHEVMHVLVNYLGPGTRGILLPYVWFNEGIAEYISGGAFTSIESLDQFTQWRNDNEGNPIDMRLYGDPGTTATAYYPMYGLAVRFLLDEKGLGKTLLDVKDMLQWMTFNNNFEASFEKYFGISVRYFRENFFDLMEYYLEVY